MSYKILTKNGIENSNVDGARAEFFNSGMRNGIVQGALNEGTFISNASNSISFDTCELRIAGHRIIIDEPIYQTFSNKPSNDTRYSFIAQINVDDNKNVDFSIIIQSASTQLIEDDLYKNLSGKGIYQVEIGRFTLLTDGTITDVVRTIDVITGGNGKGGKINVGNVTTQKIEPEFDAEVDISQRYEESKNKEYLDFSFSLPIDMTDVINTSNQALTNSQTAVSTANQSKAESAEALSNSETALSNSQTALSNSNTAISTAESAETKSDTAISTANNAESVANGIDGKATQALETSNTASETADNALSVANSIDSKATEALNNSNDALEQVNNAVKITGDQTIAGQKTFTDDINIKSVDGNDKSILIVDNENNVLLRISGSLSGLATVLNANSYFFRNKNNGSTGIILNPDVAIRPETNNKLNLGTSEVMFKDLYLSGNISNGTNNVSVANLNKPNVRVVATNYTQPLYLLSVIGTSAGVKDTWQDSRFYFVPDTQTLVTPNISDGTNNISISNIMSKANFVLDGTTLTITTT